MSFRTKLIRFFTLLGGLYFFLEFFLPEKIGDFKFGAWNDQISLGFIAISAMAVGLGLINIFSVHGAKVIFKKKDWFFSLTLLVGLLLMLLVTSLDWYRSYQVSKAADKFNMLSAYAQKLSNQKPLKPELLFKHSEAAYAEALAALNLVSIDAPETMSRFSRLSNVLAEKYKITKASYGDAQLNLSTYAAILDESASVYREALLLSYDQSLIRNLYNFLYEGIFVALGSAMFALLAFYVASAAYRAFRIRSLESGLMMLAAVLVMLGQIPFGLWISDDLPLVRLWLLEVPNSAAFRAIAIGSGVAGLIMAFRMWLSLEADKYNE